MEDQFVCPVCGYPNLSEPAWSDGSPSDEICPSCGTHFGYDDVVGGDAAKREAIYRRRRHEWRSAGSPWFSASTPRPLDWNADSEVEAVTDGLKSPCRRIDTPALAVGVTALVAEEPLAADLEPIVHPDPVHVIGTIGTSVRDLKAGEER